MSQIVLDAAAVVDLLLDNHLGRAVRRHLPGSDLLSVVHLDAEVFSALGRLHRNGELSAEAVADRLALLDQLAVDRLRITAGLTRAAWSLRDNVAVRDALYVAAAQAVGGLVLTTDARLRKAAPSHTLDPQATPRPAPELPPA